MTRCPHTSRYVAGMDELAGRIRGHAYEALVVAFAIASVVEVLVTDSIRHRPAVAVTALGWSLPFLLRRSHRFLVPLVITGAIVVLAIVAGKDTMDLATPFFAALLAAASFGQLRDRRLAYTGLAV